VRKTPIRTSSPTSTCRALPARRWRRSPLEYAPASSTPSRALGDCGPEGSCADASPHNIANAVAPIVRSQQATGTIRTSRSNAPNQRWLSPSEWEGKRGPRSVQRSLGLPSRTLRLGICSPAPCLHTYLWWALGAQTHCALLHGHTIDARSFIQDWRWMLGPKISPRRLPSAIRSHRPHRLLETPLPTLLGVTTHARIREPLLAFVGPPCR
jgi:hypothetical protein